MPKLHFILRNVTNNFDSWLELFICIFVKGGIFVWPRISLFKLPCTKRLGVAAGIEKVEKGPTYFRSLDEERHCALWHPSFYFTRYSHVFSVISLSLFSVFASHVIKIKIVTIQWKKSRVWDTIDDWYINSLAKNRSLLFSFARYLQKCVAQIYRALYGDAMFVSFWGTQIWRP